MNTCDTCKHWGANPQGENRENAKECACPEILPATLGYGTGSGFGNYTGMGTTWEPLGPKQAAIFTDSPASFCPGPKFGCVHWELDESQDGFGVPSVAHAVRCQYCGFLNQLSKPVPRAEYATTKTPCQRPGCGAVQQAIGGEWKKENA